MHAVCACLQCTLVISLLLLVRRISLSYSKPGLLVIVGNMMVLSVSTTYERP